MNFWGHAFRPFGSVERICMACGYVVPVNAKSDEKEVMDWIKQEEGCELHCGGAWHVFKRAHLISD